MQKEYKYQAFISYSHRDKAFTKWLHKRIENYKIPKSLREKYPNLPKDLKRSIFRDEEELRTSSVLGDNLKYALDHSKKLIVICSPDAVASKWVNEEIRYFKEMHGELSVLAIIKRGEPKASTSNLYDSNLEAFPKSLRYVVGEDGKFTEQETEPLAGDARSYWRREMALIKLIAGILEVDFADLWEREKEEVRKRRVIKAMFVSIILSLILYIFLIQNSLIEITTQIKKLEYQIQNIDATNKENTETIIVLNKKLKKLLKRKREKEDVLNRFGLLVESEKEVKDITDSIKLKEKMEIEKSKLKIKESSGLTNNEDDSTLNSYELNKSQVTGQSNVSVIETTSQYSKMDTKLLKVNSSYFKEENELEKCTSDKMVTYDIATGSRTGTYYQIGLDLAKYVAPDACIKLNVLSSNGSLDNVLKLISPRYPKLKFAIVQHDVLQELKKISKEGNVRAINLVQTLKVITPLYNEEIHIITDTKSDIRTFGDLRDKKISIGKQKSGTAMTSYLLYKELFNEELQKAKTQPFDDALKDLEHGNIDAIIKVASQPILRMSVEFTKNSGKYIKLLSYEEKNYAHNPVTSYYTTDIKTSSYKWINSDVATLSTKSYLITYNYKNPSNKKTIKKFVQSLKNQLSFLEQNSSKDLNTPHLKWKEVSDKCRPVLTGGWEYYSVVDEICENKNMDKDCSDSEKILGLCK